jgi:hypothetical protein
MKKYILALLLLASPAYAERLVIKNKCGEVLLTDPIGYDCYNDSQGSDNAERLSTWKALKKQAKRKGYRLPAKVVLTDPKCTRDRCDYKTYLKGKTLYFSVMSGCFNHNIEAGLEALK